LKAYRITDYLVAAALMQNEVIAKDSYEDGMDFIMPNLVDEFWIGVKVDDQVVGAFRFEQMTRVMWQIHGAMLPQHRKLYSKKASRIALRWMAKNVGKLATVICQIPETYTNIIKHATVLGFTLYGTIPDAYLKNDTIQNLVIYGIAKEEIEKY